jgi:membrane-bound lytic murein transglycosylase D
MLITLERALLAGGLAALAGLVAPIAASGQNSGPAAASQAAVAQTAPASASQTASPEPSPRDRQLIDAVETAYHSGLKDYQAGHVASARANFDYAVDLLLKCNCDLKSDDALSEEFDHIVDAVNTLEMDALQQNGPAAPAEPTPVEAAGDITTPANPNVRATATAELKTTVSDLPLVMNDYVAAYVDFFQNSPKGHGTIVASLERMGRYKDMIQQVLREEGVPQDLIYQAFAESGFRPQAVNAKSGAAGMWQFMPWGTYGLSHTAWYDERFDPVKATHAYAREIKKMYDQLGDWYLAMAAYDWGPGNVQKAVQRTGYADFWELYRRNNLPQETKNYVPVFLAVTLMAKNPKQYGLEEITTDPPLLTDTVKTDYAVDLRLVSDIVGAPVQEIAGLNPSLLRMSTPPDESFDLHLPAGTGDVFQKDIAAIPVEKRRYWRFHTVAEGDTLASLACVGVGVGVCESADAGRGPGWGGFADYPAGTGERWHIAEHAIPAESWGYAGDDCGSVWGDGGATAALEQSAQQRDCAGAWTVCVGAGAYFGIALRQEAAWFDEGVGKIRGAHGEEVVGK